jgi:CheY-like chemotaxis protein
MDHMMPGMDGVETTAAIRAWEKESGNTEAPIIALTANAMQGMKEIYLNLGFNDYLSKPIFPKLLDDIIVRWIGGGEPKLGNGLPPPILTEMEVMRIDVLNHYRKSFEITRTDEKFDSAYFEKFISLIELLCMENLAAGLKEQAVLLLNAGQRRDIQKIREILPAFCEAINKRTANAEHNTVEELGEILPRLKKALKAEDSIKAGSILAEMAALNLDNKGRELYFLLYDLLYENNLQKANDTIYVWERLKL